MTWRYGHCEVLKAAATIQQRDDGCCRHIWLLHARVLSVLQCAVWRASLVCCSLVSGECLYAWFFGSSSAQISTVVRKASIQNR